MMKVYIREHFLGFAYLTFVHYWNLELVKTNMTYLFNDTLHTLMVIRASDVWLVRLT